MKRLLVGAVFLLAVGTALAQISLPFPGPGSNVGAPTCTANTQGGGTFSNVVGLWHFDGTLNDTSGNGHNGTFTASSAFAGTSKFGTNSVAPASGGGVDTGTGYPTTISGDFTLETWIFQPSTTNYGGFMGDSAATLAWYLITGASGGIQLTPPGNTTITGTNPVGSWAHYALVRQSGTLRLYVNGTQQGTGANSGTIFGAGNVVLGNIGTNGTYYIHGNMDEVRISNMARYPSGTTFSVQTTAFCDF